YCYIFICNTDLDIIGRKQLVISHIICLDTHKCCGMVRLGIAVPPFSAYMDFLHIFFQFFRIFHQLLIVTLLHRFMMATAMYKCGFVYLPHLSIFAGGLL